MENIILRLWQFLYCLYKIQKKRKPAQIIMSMILFLQSFWCQWRSPGPHRNLTTKFLQTEKYETCPVNRKVKSITGSVFVLVSREAAILAQNALETLWRLRPDTLGKLTALPQTS